MTTTTTTAFYMVCALIALGTLWLRATTHYIVQADRLLIQGAGFIWMEIFFRDVEEIEPQAVFFDKLCQIRMYQRGFRKMLRIRKRRGFRYVLINPRDPEPIIEAYHRYHTDIRARLKSEIPGPMPDFLRRPR
jgi:hypothetical protein